MQINSLARGFVVFWLICHHQTHSFSVPRTNDYRHRTAAVAAAGSAGAGSGAGGASTGEVITSAGGKGSSSAVAAASEERAAEPSCEELKAMWRFSKRQSRAAEITNEIPTYRDPFTYNVWEPYTASTAARSRSIGGMRIGYRGRPVYGRVVTKVPMLRIHDVAERNRAFEEVARLYGSVHKTSQEPRRRHTAFRLSGGDRINPMGGIASQAGSFQHLKELIQTERARELQEQRRAEEAAARNAALKELARNNHRAQMSNYRDAYNYETFDSHDDVEDRETGGNMRDGKTILAFPDLLAPAARFGPSAARDNDARFVDDYTYYRDRPRTQRSYFHPSTFDNNMDGFDGVVF